MDPDEEKTINDENQVDEDKEIQEAVKVDEEKQAEEDQKPATDDDTTKKPTNQPMARSISRSSSSSPTNSILFYGVTYLGCSSVNAPKSEAEINRIMSTLNEQAAVTIEVTMAMPQTIDDKIVLYDAKSNGESKIAEYKMSHVLFVVRGAKASPESACFAFTTCHGDSVDNLIFSCHVFRCNLVEAVSKILYSFWTVFNRYTHFKVLIYNPTNDYNHLKLSQNQQQQQQNQPQQQQSRQTRSSLESTAGQISSVASSLFGSIQSSLININSSSSAGLSANLGGYINSNSSSGSAGILSGTPGLGFTELCEFALELSGDGSRGEDQFVFRAHLDIREEDPKNPGTFASVPKEKEFFKLRKNLDKQINIQIQQLSNQPLEIERCFGILMCQGRNVSHKDMQLLQTISMGKSANNPISGNVSSGAAAATAETATGSNFKSSNQSLNSQTSATSNWNSTYVKNSYLVSALWKPVETTASLQVLNEETQKNARVFMTIAVDLVLNGLQDPVRFCIETKVRIYPQNEKFWVYQKHKHIEPFFLQIARAAASSPKPVSSTSSNSAGSLSLQSIYSSTELVRKKHAIEHQKKIDSTSEVDSNNQQSQMINLSDDENDLVMSGLGNVSKDCAQEDLMDWSEILAKWRKATWNERPKGLQNLVRKGIPEALRGEVWQLLAGCNEDEKSMIEAFRLLLSKDSPCENVILRDINRTFPGHAYFQDEAGQQALYKLSKAYSIYDEEVGYCQGLSFLIASLLLHMPEEQAFNLLVKIMYRYEIREIYKTNFECLHLRFFQLESLIRDFIPELYEHFVDINVEPHMYASQWFLTLFTAKFPLYMVFRILDLFLCEGFMVVFSVALALLKSSQRDLLALDFEGVLKYFRVYLPKKFRTEANFKELMSVWAPLHGKITEKRLKKYEKIYTARKEEEALKQDPLIRYERECKQLTALVRRLEQENDDLANEYIDAKIALSKQLEELRDDYEVVKSELIKYKTDYQNRLNESNDTNKRLMSELDQIKTMWRKESERYQGELERTNIIISEYKQICNTLSSKAVKTSSSRKKSSGENRNEVNGGENQPGDEPPTNRRKSTSSTTSSSDSFIDLNLEDANLTKIRASDVVNRNDPVDEEDDQANKIKQLELELARVKLELVDAQCRNQEFDHKLKSVLNNASSISQDSSTEGSSSNNPTATAKSLSQTSLSNGDGSNTIKSGSSNPQTGVNYSSNYSSMSNSNNSVSSPTSTSSNNSNNWLSKTLTQFKEATNQVVQKAQKVKLNSTDSANVIK